MTAIEWIVSIVRLGLLGLECLASVALSFLLEMFHQARARLRIWYYLERGWVTPAQVHEVLTGEGWRCEFRPVKGGYERVYRRAGLIGKVVVRVQARSKAYRPR